MNMPRGSLLFTFSIQDTSWTPLYLTRLVYHWGSGSLFSERLAVVNPPLITPSLKFVLTCLRGISVRLSCYPRCLSGSDSGCAAIKLTSWLPSAQQLQRYASALQTGKVGYEVNGVGLNSRVPESRKWILPFAEPQSTGVNGRAKNVTNGHGT